MANFRYSATWYSETKKTFWGNEVSTGCDIREYEFVNNRVRIIQKFHPDNKITYVFKDRWNKNKLITEFTANELNDIKELMEWIEENKERLYPFLIRNKK